MSNKSKILIIENSINVTGALKSILLASKCLGENFEFQFVIPKNSIGKSLIESHGFKHIYEFPMKELSRQLTSILLYIPYLVLNTYRLNRLIKTNSISLIHVNDIYNLLPAMNRLLGNKTPYVCHIRFMPDRFPNLLFSFWFKLHLRYANEIIAVSKIVSSQLPKSQKVTVVHDQIPLERQSGDQTDWEAAKSSYTFLYLSNFMQGKGHDLAIEAFAKIHHELPNWKLRLVGGDLGLTKNIKYREGLIERTKHLGIYSKTEWIGFTKEVEFEYKQADIVLNFSQSESFSMTCLEALFFGRPLIATDSGGPSEILEGGQIGILVPNGDIKSMADSMERLAKSPKERNKIGAQARLVVTEKFSSENTSMKLKMLYKKILGQ